VQIANKMGLQNNIYEKEGFTGELDVQMIGYIEVSLADATRESTDCSN
jgi:hypothetical protein